LLVTTISTFYLCSILNTDDVVMQVTALKVLATALGKGEKSLVYFYEEHHVSRLIMCLISLKFMIYYFIADGGSWGCMSASSSPKPTMDCSFLGDGVPEYVIVLERKSYIIVSSLETAIYLAFSIYYCLNLEYPMES